APPSPSPCWQPCRCRAPSPSCSATECCSVPATSASSSGRWSRHSLSTCRLRPPCCDGTASASPASGVGSSPGCPPARLSAPSASAVIGGRPGPSNLDDVARGAGNRAVIEHALELLNQHDLDAYYE